MELGTIPKSTTPCHTAKKQRRLATGRTLRIRGVSTFTCSYAIVVSRLESAL